MKTGENLSVSTKPLVAGVEPTKSNVAPGWLHIHATSAIASDGLFKVSLYDDFGNIYSCKMTREGIDRVSLYDGIENVWYDGTVIKLRTYGTTAL